MTLSTRQEGVVAQIFDRVAEITGVTPDRMTSKSREAGVVQARWVAMYSIRHTLGLGTKAIGKMFNRDHTSVIHACSKVEDSPALDHMVFEATDGMTRPKASTPNPSINEATRLLVDAQEMLNKAVAILAQVKPDTEDQLARLEDAGVIKPENEREQP